MKKILTIVPGPVIAWVNAWKGIFTDSGIFPIGDTSSPDVTAAALSTIFVVFLWYAFSKSSGRTQLITSVAAGSLAVLSVVVIFYCRHVLSYEGKKEFVLLVRDAWYYTYIFFIICTSIAISQILAFAFNSSSGPGERAKGR
jgi:hypothetical protein